MRVNDDLISLYKAYHTKFEGSDRVASALVLAHVIRDLHEEIESNLSYVPEKIEKMRESVKETLENIAGRIG